MMQSKGPAREREGEREREREKRERESRRRERRREIEKSRDCLLWKRRDDKYIYIYGAFNNFPDFIRIGI